LGKERRREEKKARVPARGELTGGIYSLSFPLIPLFVSEKRRLLF
jgi:hypothetical protein